MIFQAIFEEIKNYLINSDVSNIKEHIAVQVNLIGFGGGKFYVEVINGSLKIEPYEYRDNDAGISVSVNDFKKLADGSLNIVAALSSGRLKTTGDVEKLITLYNAIATNK